MPKEFSSKKQATSIFKGELEEDVGGGKPFPKNSSTTRQNQEQGQERIDRGDDTMQPRDEHGHFAELALVGKTPKYEHPDHEYKGSDILKRVQERLRNSKYNFNRVLKDKMNNMSYKEFKELLERAFSGEKMGARADTQDNVVRSTKGISETTFGKDTGDITGRYIQLAYGGKKMMGNWARENAVDDLGNALADRKYLESKKAETQAKLEKAKEKGDEKSIKRITNQLKSYENLIKANDKLQSDISSKFTAEDKAEWEGRE